MDINPYKICSENLTEERPFGKLRHRWEDNIKMNFRETVSEDVDWIQLADSCVKWWAFVNMVVNFAFHKSREFPD
jgi:hypothetical protein